MGADRSKTKGPALGGPHSFERVVYTLPEFCFRNGISRPTYHRLRAEGRGPVEMRLGLNKILVTAEAEREWHRQMQQPRPDLEIRTVERAVMAGGAAAKSNKHVSKRGRAHDSAPKHSKTRVQQKAKGPAD